MSYLIDNKADCKNRPHQPIQLNHQWSIMNTYDQSICIEYTSMDIFQPI